jgi:hypothetical protein
MPLWAFRLRTGVSAESTIGVLTEGRTFLIYALTEKEALEKFLSILPPLQGRDPHEDIESLGMTKSGVGARLIADNAPARETRR